MGTRAPLARLMGMVRTALLLPPVALLTIAACGSSNGVDEQTASSAGAQAPLNGGTGARADLPDAAPPTFVSPVEGVDGINDGYPDMTPPRLTPDADRGEKGARNVLVTWARAIELQEFDQAWAMLDPASQDRWSKAEFAAIFAPLRDVAVAVPNGVMEGAAGSLYYSGLVEITAEDADGRPVRIEGPLVLRRANDVPGATPEQVRWRFHSADLAVTH